MQGTVDGGGPLSGCGVVVLLAGKGIGLEAATVWGWRQGPRRLSQIAVPNAGHNTRISLAKLFDVAPTLLV